MYRKWDDISYMKSYIKIDRRTNNIIHLSNGTMKYDYKKFDDFWDAIKQDYKENPTDEQLKDSIACCFADEHDRKDVFRKFKEGIYKLD